MTVRSGWMKPSNPLASVKHWRLAFPAGGVQVDVELARLDARELQKLGHQLCQSIHFDVHSPQEVRAGVCVVDCS
jgi:hypothetical protein